MNNTYFRRRYISNITFVSAAVNFAQQLDITVIHRVQPAIRYAYKVK